MEKLAVHGGKPVRTTEYPAWPVSGSRELELLQQVLFSAQWGGYHEYVEEFENSSAGSMTPTTASRLPTVRSRSR